MEHGKSRYPTVTSAQTPRQSWGSGSPEQASNLEYQADQYTGGDDLKIINVFPLSVCNHPLLKGSIKCVSEHH